jgi:hypothetical protein
MSRTEISWTGDNGQVTIAGMIEDKSESGLGIRTAKPIPVGTRVTVKYRNHDVAAVVRRCMKDSFSSFIGVSFEQEDITGNPPVPNEL